MRCTSFLSLAVFGHVSYGLWKEPDLPGPDPQRNQQLEAMLAAHTASEEESRFTGHDEHTSQSSFSRLENMPCFL
jgi:hypothetical protein